MEQRLEICHPKLEDNINLYEQWAIPSSGLIQLPYYHLDNTVWDEIAKVNVVVARHDIEMMPEEEAVCRLCFHMFRDDQNVLKTVCRCRFTLMHDHCYRKGSMENKCGVCDQDMEYIPVNVLRASASITTPTTRSTTPETKQKLQKSIWTSCFCSC